MVPNRESPEAGSVSRSIPDEREPFHVVVLAPYLDGSDVSEIGTAFQLLSAMIATGRIRMTILAVHRVGRPFLSLQLPAAEVVIWTEPVWLRRLGRFNDIIQPINFPFYRSARRWLKKALSEGRRIDLVHQMLPRAPRYPSPLVGLGLPYLIGPVGGSIAMPRAFRGGGGEHWFAGIRNLDGLRFRFDPWLRRGFSNAAEVLVVAPYMARILRPLPIVRPRPFMAIGVESLPPRRGTPRAAGELRLLFVGRAVRTKGLREAVRAMALLSDLDKVTLTVIGDGPDLPIARSLVRELGIEARVTFLGRLPRDEVETHYAAHHALLFPSFRESMGAVLFEAMRWGLPVITVDHGGPGDIVDDTCGRRVPVTTPEQMPRDLATQCRALALDPGLWQALSQGARDKTAREALWSDKAAQMLDIYNDILTAVSPAPRPAGGATQGQAT